MKRTPKMIELETRAQTEIGALRHTMSRWHTHGEDPSLGSAQMIWRESTCRACDNAVTYYVSEGLLSGGALRIKCDKGDYRLAAASSGRTTWPRMYRP